MQYRRMGRTGLVVSEVCMGTMTFGDSTDEAEAQRIFDRCLDVGVNFFDTADMYTGTKSEQILGTLIQDKRDRLVIATKVFNPVGPAANDLGLSRKHIIKACEDSLRRLKTDYIDLYQAHADDGWTPLEETLSAFDQLVRDGKVRYIGASNYTTWRLSDALWTSETNGWARYDCLQPLYNLIERGLDAEMLPLCRAKGVGVICWSPLAAGWLTGKYRDKSTVDKNARLMGPGGARSGWMGAAVEKEKILDLVLETARELDATPAQVALRWVLDQDGITSAIVGARNVEQLNDNLGAVDVKLPPEVWKKIDRASRLPLTYPTTVAFFSDMRRQEQMSKLKAAAKKNKT